MAKKGIVNNLLYGKGDNKDFTTANLPSTRRKQFFYIFKRNYLKLFYYNLLIALCFLPALCWYIMARDFLEMLPQLDDIENIKANLLQISLIQDLPTAIFIMLGFLILPGFTYIIRKLMWDEVVVFKTDFKKGFKNSYKQFLFIGFLAGLVLFFFGYGLNTLFISELNPVVMIAVLAILIIITVLFIIAMMYMMYLSSLYNLTNLQMVLYAFKLTIKDLFKNLGMFFITFALIFIWLWFTKIFNVITIFVLFIYGYIYIMLAFGELTMYSFDKYINVKQYPDFVRKGLSK